MVETNQRGNANAKRNSHKHKDCYCTVALCSGNKLHAGKKVASLLKSGKFGTSHFFSGEFVLFF
jgi:hypothetical protein